MGRKIHSLYPHDYFGGHGWLPVPRLFAKWLLFDLIPQCAWKKEEGRKEGTESVISLLNGWLRSGKSGDFGPPTPFSQIYG